MTNRIAVWVNEHCAFGKGKRRWEKIAKACDLRLSPMDVYKSSEGAIAESCVSWVCDHLKLGTRKFIAVGGDGTVHHLANSLVFANNYLEIEAAEITLGAIGTGSSNDFHKPFSCLNAKFIAGYPCRLDFSHGILSDLMRLQDMSTQREEFAIINASLGITAEANHYFNFPDGKLGAMKGLSTNLAIFYAALRTLFRYEPANIAIYIDEKFSEKINLTNLGIVKNRHFSGSFRYERGAHPFSGDFYLHLCKDMTRFECLKTLFCLARGKFNGLSKTLSMRAKSLRITADLPFCVEIDGEVSLMKDLKVSIEPRRINLCQ